MKKRSLLFLLPFLGMILTGCGKDSQQPSNPSNPGEQQSGEDHPSGEDQNVSPTSIKLAQTAKDMKPGDKWQLEVQWTPENTTQRGLICSSSNEQVATVDETGKVTAVAPGWADITVKSKVNVSLSYNAKVLVLPTTLTHAGTAEDPFTTAEAVSIAKLINSKKNSAEQYYVKGIVKTIVKFDATKGAIIDLTAGEDVFEIYSLKGPQGKIYEGIDVVPGDEVTVKAQIKNYNGTYETGDSGEIISVNKLVTEYVAAQPTMSLKSKATGQIEALTRGTPTGITYESDAPTIASVSNAGLVTAVAVGDAKITVTASYEGGSTKTCEVHVVVLPDTVHAGTAEDPFDLADACAYANALPENGKTDDAYYIKGVVTKMASKAGDAAQYGNLTWWFESGDLAFECYQVFAGPAAQEGGELEKFVNDDDIAVGDEVTVYSPFTKYVSKSGSITLETVQKVGYVTNIVKNQVTGIQSVKEGPTQVELGSEKDSLLSEFTLVLTSNTGFTIEKNPTAIELDTSVAGDAIVAVLSYGNFTINYTLKVVEIPPVMSDAVYYLGCKVGEEEIKYVGAPSVAKTSPKAFASQYDAQEIRAIPVEGKKDVYKLAVEGSDPKQYLYISDVTSNSSVTFDNTDAAIATEWKAVRADDGSFTLQYDYVEEGTPKTRYLEYYASNEQFRSYVNAKTNPSSFVIVEAALPTALKVENPPTEGYVNESLDLSGKVKATFNGVEQVVTNYKVSPAKFEQVAGGKEVTVSFKGLTTKFNVEVKARTLTGIAIAGDLTTKTYSEADNSWDFSGLTITASYDGAPADPNFDVSKVTFTADKTPAEVLAAGDGKLVITAKVTADESKTAEITITGLTITPIPHNIDVIDVKSVTGLTGSYKDFSLKFASDATYNFNAMKKTDATNGDSLQFGKNALRFFTTGSNRNIRSIAFDVNENTTANGEISVYVNNDVMSSTYITPDTPTATITKASESKTVEIPEGTNVRNFCFKTNGNAFYLNSITVTYDDQVITSCVDSLTLNVTEKTLHIGESLQLTATINGFGEKGSVTWESSDSSVAGVDENGLVTAKAVGANPVVITAKSVLDSTKTAICTVTVEAARTFTTLSVEGGFKTEYTTKDTDFVSNELKVFANYSDESKDEIIDYTVTWSAAFDATAGEHKSTPTIHWDGHDLQLGEVSYTVAAPQPEEQIYKSCSFAAANSGKKLTDYAAEGSYTDDGFKINTFGAANNNNGWDYVRVCKKQTTNGVAYFATDEAIDKAVTKATINFTKLTNGRINSAKLLISTNSDFSGATEISFTAKLGLNTIVIAEPAENCYYKFLFDYTNSSGTSGGVEIDSVAFYAVY